MNPGIGTTTANNCYFLPEDFRQTIFHNLLNAYRIGLILPTVIGSAVVGYFKEVSHTDCQLTIDN
jgi:hypothetical protein